MTNLAKRIDTDDIADGAVDITKLSSAVQAELGGTAVLTTKGDLAGFDTAPARVPVGTNGQVLTADSAQAKGVKWATPTAVPLVKTARLTTGSIPFGTSVDVVVPWGVAFADVNYTVSASLEGATGATGLQINRVVAKIGASATVSVQNTSVDTALTGTLNLIGIHD